MRSRAVMVLGAALTVGATGVAAAQDVPRASTTSTRGVLAGTVRDPHGSAIAGARVSTDSATVSITDSSGSFLLRGLVPGAVLVRVRRLGFTPFAWQVEVGTEPRSIDLVLEPVAQLLPAVRVSAPIDASRSRLAGFYARRNRRLGAYITREDIERRNDLTLTEALRRIPGVRPYRMRGALGHSVRLAGAACPPLVFVNGFPASLGSFDLDMFDLASVEGIEVYQRGASVPPDFVGPYGAEACGVIAIWSRPSRPRTSTANRHGDPPDMEALIRTGAVYLPSDVDVPARYIVASALPQYPDSLFRAGMPGRVVAQFVVDTLGGVEAGTVSIVSTSHPALSAAVRSAAPTARFEPARRNGTLVRTLVSLPFEFDPRLAAPRPPE